MKKIFFLLLLFLSWATIFCQTSYQGIWVLKDIGVDSIPMPEGDIWYPDSLRPYNGVPTVFKLDCTGLVVFYGDITDYSVPAFTRRSTLITQEGDCIFYWIPSTSMYEYLATWVKDHFVIYWADESKSLHYEKVDEEIFSQEELQRLNPKDDGFVYFQGRLRPIQPYYHCNIPQKN